MASLFEGTPQTTTNPTFSTTESPQWLQDAIYRQIQTAQNVASIPYQPYQGQLVAGTTPYQQAAWQQVAQGQNAWQPGYNAAFSGFQNLASSPGSAAAQQPYADKQAGALGGINYNAGMTAAQPYANQSAGALGGINYNSAMNAAQPYANQSAGALNGVNYNAGTNAAQPYLSSAMTSGGGLAAAQPWLNASAGSSAGKIGDFMNPYISGVTDQIAKLGARNLTENLLPGVSDSFIKAGQFGGSRMGEFGERALRDTQEAVLGQQSNALQSGYNTALTAAQNEQQRLTNIGSEYGQLGSANQNALISGAQLAGNLGNTAVQNRLTGANQYANLASTLGGLQNQSTQNQLSGANQYANLASTLGGLQNQSTQNQLSGASQWGQLGQNAANASQNDRSLQSNIYGNLGSLGTQAQQNTLNGASALGAAGNAQQQQRQNELNAMYQQYTQEQAYPQQQMDWLKGQLTGAGSLAPSSSYGYNTNTQYGPSTAAQVGGLGSLIGGISQFFAEGGRVKGYANGGSSDQPETYEEFVARMYGTDPEVGDDDYQVAQVDPQMYQADPQEQIAQAQQMPQQAPQLGQPQAATPSNAAPIDLSGVNPELAQLYQLVNQPSPYKSQIADAQQKAQEAQKAYEQNLMQTVEHGDEGPSKAELLFRLSSAFLNPGKTGNFTEALGNVGSTLAGYEGEKRAAGQQNLDRKQQAMSELNKSRFGLAREDLNTLRGLAADDSKDARSIRSELIKQAIASGKPLSEAGKIGQDIGLTGQSLADFIKEYAFKDQNKPTDDMREYEAAKSQGYKGTITDFIRENKRAGASNVTVTQSGEKKFAETLAGQVGEQVAGTAAAAKGAVGTINTVHRIREALDDGAYVGPLAGAQTWLTRVGDKLGVGGKDAAEKLQNTRKAIQGLAQLNLDAAAQMKGQGQITEAERALLERATGGGIDQFQPEELKSLLDTNEKIARYKIKQNRASVEKLRKQPGVEGIADYFDVEDPGEYVAPKPKSKFNFIGVR